MTDHTTTLVVDFDDTLAITLNRDWENATPNIELIKKLNGLYEQGWTIHVVTARGQISCAGDSVAADKKYRKQIEEWLTNNNVKYNSLSFEKKLGAYYIDDKGITPSDFVLHFEQEELGGGMSGASVIYDKISNTVQKTAKNTHEAVAWYEYAQKHFNTPEIISVIGNTIKMEKLFEYDGGIGKILDVAHSFKYHPALNIGLADRAGMYTKRCVSRIKKILRDDTLDFDFIESCIEWAMYKTPQSFSHGDFSISNIMTDRFHKKVYLIDPINDPTLPSSWVMDIAKLYMSIEFNHGEDSADLNTIKLFVNNKTSSDFTPLSFDVIRCHVIGHYCRIFPYVDDIKRSKILRLINKHCALCS